MEMAIPTDAHKKLNTIVGTWHGREKMFPTPWDPKGGEAVGRVVNRPAIDGFAVVQDYEQQRGATVNFRGHGVFTWNPSEQSYMLYWHDSTGMPQNVFRGTFVDKTLILTNNAPHGITRATWIYADEHHYSYKMELSVNGNQWQTVLEGTYDRVK
jgi:hypothetical protein